MPDRADARTESTRSKSEWVPASVTDSLSSNLREEDLVHVLGYMHFSSGRPDPKMLAAMNRLYGLALEVGSSTNRPFAGMPAWLTIQQWLQDRLTMLGQSQNAFESGGQAAQVLEVVWMDLLPSFLDFHRDLLFHQEPEGLFNGLFLGKAIEIVLAVGGPFDDRARIVTEAIRRLNNYVGYRPVAVLESEQLEPYTNEWVCPIPLYVRDVGVAIGPYQQIVTLALDILHRTDPGILRAAGFELDMLDELAFDPRAYDFDHPVNRRPNYQFGTWDFRSADENGYYRRFVLQQINIDALLARVQQEKELPSDQLLVEAATVLVGTILMASGITSWGPAAYDSTVTLVSLLGPIANYRDEFYADQLESFKGEHAARLQEESAKRRQPFGGARQHLNNFMARRRASQLEHIQLARLFARMGNSDNARAETDVVSVPSARLLCRIDCLLTTGKHMLRDGNLQMAVRIPDDIIDLLQRAIECGAFVDPWNILGFGGNFPYFPSSEAACEDHRIGELNALLERISAFLSRLWREASAADNREAAATVRQSFVELANWWHKFAAHELADINGINLLDSYQSAELVAQALRLWHAGGAAAGDVKFWAQHAELFDSPRAYSLVIEALLERHDYVASLALLVHWLGEARETGLKSGETEFSEFAQRWFYQMNRHFTNKVPVEPQRLGPIDDDVIGNDDDEPALPEPNTQIPNPVLIEAQKQCWTLTKRFFDFIEANAEELWQAPSFNLDSVRRDSHSAPAEQVENDEDAWPEEEDADETFGAAYEDVVFEDSTNDGIDGPVYEEETDTPDELITESRRLSEHLGFLVAIAKMLKHAALQTCLDRRTAVHDKSQVDVRIESLEQWCRQSSLHLRGALTLLDQIKKFHVARGGADSDSMSRYDRKRLIKESLIDRAIQAAVEIADSRRMLLAAIYAINPQRKDDHSLDSQDMNPHDWDIVELFSSLLAGNRDAVEKTFNKFLVELRQEKLLYVPLARGGEPCEIFSVRLRRRSLSHLLMWLPRQGFFLPACRLIETARNMEHHNPVGPGAVTEFDELFQIAFGSMARAVVRNAYSFRPNNGVLQEMELEHIVESAIIEPAIPRLLGLVERLTEVLLHTWLMHSRTLRLSVLELIDSATVWTELTDFIKTYGKGVFTQGFFKLSNVRAILHQGVEPWLRQLLDANETSALSPILDAIHNKKLSLAVAAKNITLILESILDHFAEYRDYNSTTTQSDRGEMIYMLLDFLRLRVRYDRVSWNLRPVFLAHEVLVRNGCQQTAQQWRRALAERVTREANQYQAELVRLQEQYAMQMPTIADRLGERFLKPMSIGRMRALIRPAMKQLQKNPRAVSPAFEVLLQESHLMMREPSGVGFDVPEWLIALHEEVDEIVESSWTQTKDLAFERAVPFIFLRAAEIESQFDAFAKQSRVRNLP